MCSQRSAARRRPAFSLEKENHMFAARKQNMCVGASYIVVLAAGECALVSFAVSLNLQVPANSCNGKTRCCCSCSLNV